ncbi:MAG: MFS transporter [Actinomycetota bacterium]|nr:MFS transporter [Actinomycetota bacterium]
MTEEEQKVRRAESRWMSRGVAGIGAASFFSDSGHEIVTSLLPNFLASTLGAPAAALGLIEGISDGLAGGARLVGGALADDPGRRKALAVGGYSTTPIFSSLISVATAAWQVGLLRAVAWGARGLRVPARNAILADIAPASAYGRAYGFERAMDNFGAIVGPLAALALVGLVGVRTSIAVSVIPGLLAAVAIVYAIRRSPGQHRFERRPLKIQVRPVLKGPLGRMMLAITAFELGNVAATMLILRANRLLEPGYGEREATQIAIGLYVAYNLAASLVSVPAGRAGDRIGMKTVLLAGTASFAVSYIGFAAGGAIPALALWFVAAGFGIGCVETAEHAAVATLAPERVRASAFGLLAAIQSVGNLAASGVAGIVWSSISPRAAFGYLAACMLVASVAVATLRSGRSNEGNQSGNGIPGGEKST